MKAITITKVASYLYRKDYENKLRFRIDEATKKKHPKDNVVLKDCFNTTELEELSILLGKLFFTKTVQEWRKISKKLTKESHYELADIINTYTTKASINKNIHVPFTLEEMDKLDGLGV